MSDGPFSRFKFTAQFDMFNAHTVWVEALSPGEAWLEFGRFISRQASTPAPVAVFCRMVRPAPVVVSCRMVRPALLEPPDPNGPVGKPA